MSGKTPVSVIVIAKNEEKIIELCLKSVAGWASEIMVVDDFSTDKTREIASRYATTVLQRATDVEGRQRNWACAQARNDWILSLDADECATPELCAEISRLLSSTPAFPGYSIPRRNYVGKYWIRWGGAYPAAQLRLFRKDKIRYEEVAVHPRMYLDGPGGHLKSDMIHYSWDDLAEMVAKVNGQTTLEAQKWVQMNRKMSAVRAIWRTFDRFFRRYFKKQGFRDGYIGFMYSFQDSLYQILSYVKYRDILDKKTTAGK